MNSSAGEGAPSGKGLWRLQRKAGSTASSAGAPPSVSVIIPAYNQSEHLGDCLAAILTAGELGCEIIVVDDGSTDDTAAIARAKGVHVVASLTNRGPAAARNLGARHARGALLVFVDADVVLAADALSRLIETLCRAPFLDAVFGSYDSEPHAVGTISAYRNLLHHFTHQTAASEASTFWAGCGAVRRDAFETVGGFDEGAWLRYVEDIELGYRLRRAGCRIRNDNAILATHRKRWRLGSMVRTDILWRARPWSRLFLLGHGPLINDLNLRWSQRAAVALTASGAALAPVGLLAPEAVVIATTAVAAALVINAPLFAFLYARRGLWFALKCMPLHLVHHLSGAAGLILAWSEICTAAWPRHRRRIAA